MKGKEIFLIRHGETDYNRLGLVQGSGVDASLNETGRRQADAFYQKYKEHGFDKIYVSELRRTWQTVEPFVRAGFPIEEHEALNEMSWGSLEGKALSPSDREDFFYLIESWKAGETDRSIAGGESPLDVALRQENFLEILFSRPKEKRVLICMHGRAMRILLCLLTNRPLKDMDFFSHHNLGLYHLIVDESGCASLCLQDCTDHLKAVGI